jgi:hypothetical protein
MRIIFLILLKLYLCRFLLPRSSDSREKLRSALEVSYGDGRRLTTRDTPSTFSLPVHIQFLTLSLEKQSTSPKTIFPLGFLQLVKVEEKTTTHFSEAVFSEVVGGGCNREYGYLFTVLPSINVSILRCISLSLSRKWMAFSNLVTEKNLIKEQFTHFWAKWPETTKNLSTQGQ